MGACAWVWRGQTKKEKGKGKASHGVRQLGEAHAEEGLRGTEVRGGFLRLEDRAGVVQFVVVQPG